MLLQTHGAKSVTVSTKTKTKERGEDARDFTSPANSYTSLTMRTQAHWCPTSRGGKQKDWDRHPPERWSDRRRWRWSTSLTWFVAIAPQRSSIGCASLALQRCCRLSDPRPSPAAPRAPWSATCSVPRLIDPAGSRSGQRWWRRCSRSPPRTRRCSSCGARAPGRAPRRGRATGSGRKTSRPSRHHNRRWRGPGACGPGRWWCGVRWILSGIGLFGTPFGSGLLLLRASCSDRRVVGFCVLGCSGRASRRTGRSWRACQFRLVLPKIWPVCRGCPSSYPCLSKDESSGYPPNCTVH